MRPTTRQFQKLHVAPDVPHDLELCPTSRCICCLILERATCGLEAKKVQYSSARFHAAISRIDSPSFDISPNIPTVGAFNSYSLSLSWNGVAPGTLVSNFFARPPQSDP